MQYVFFGMGLLMAALGLMIKRFKLYGLIAGYNTASAKEKERVDIERLGPFMGNCLYAMAALFFAMGALALMGFESLAGLGFFVLPVIVIYMVYRANSQYMKNPTKKDKKVAVAVSAALVIITAGIFTAIASAAREPAITLEDGAVRVSGAYGLELEKEGAEISLAEALPDISARTNGLDFLSVLKGEFRTAEGEKIYLNIQNTTPPFILIVSEGKRYYLNCSAPEKTMAAYQRIAVHP